MMAVMVLPLAGRGALCTYPSNLDMAFEIISLESKPVYFTHIFGQKLAILGETLNGGCHVYFCRDYVNGKNILLNGLKRLPRPKSAISIQHSTSSILITSAAVLHRSSRRK